MSAAFNLRRMLDEILDDEKVSTSKTKRVSQEDIRKFLNERKLRRSESRDPVVQTSAEWPASAEQSRNDPVPESQGPQPGVQPMNRPAVVGRPGHFSSLDSRGGGDPSGRGGACPLCSHFQNLHVPTGVIPFRIMLKYRLIPVHVGARVIEVAMENPADSAAIHDVELLTGKRVEPVRGDPEVLNRVLEVPGAEWTGGGGPASSQPLSMPGPLATLLEMPFITEGSELLISQGDSPWIRTAAGMERTGMPLVGAMECAQFARSMMNEAQWERYLSEGVAGFAWEDPAYGRFRVRVFRERNAPSLAIRRIPDPIPEMEELGLPRWMVEMTQMPSGLIIITGPSGHGKTMTLHALVHRINARRACRIVTLEDPIEVVHRSIMSLVSQREIGTDARSWRDGIKQARRQGADVIVVGELCSKGAFMESLAAAQAGRLVMTTLEATEPMQAISRLIDSVPAPVKAGAKIMMREGELLIVAQKLLATPNGAGARPFCERLEEGRGLRDLPASVSSDRPVTSAGDLQTFSDRGGQASPG
jgi:twitching motility protein PilT